MMKLWILFPRRLHTGQWNKWDVVRTLVVRAPNARSAREIAASECWDEGKHAWLDNQLSTCIQLFQKGEKGVIIKDTVQG